MAARALELSSVRRAVSSAMVRRSRRTIIASLLCHPGTTLPDRPTTRATKRLEWARGRGAAHSRVLDPVGLPAARLRSDGRADAARDLERPAAQRARGGGAEPTRLPGLAGPGAGSAHQPAMAAAGADGRGGGGRGGPGLTDRRSLTLCVRPPSVPLGSFVC